MKLVPPRLKRVDLKGAFGFDADFFAAQKRLFESIVGQTAEVRFSLQVRSGTKYEVDTVEGLALLPFDDVRGRSSFSVEYKAGGQSLEIDVRYWSPAWVTISSWSEQAAERLASEAVSGVEARRLWYSWIFSAWTGGLVAIPAGLLLGAALPLSSMQVSSIRTVLFACVAYALGVGAAALARRMLFDTVVMTIGAEAARQATLAKGRGYLFGTVIGGIGLAVVGAAASAFFSQP